MQPVYGHKCFNLSVVKRWCRKFSNGRTSLVDNKRSGRHLAATDNDVVKKIDQFIRTDRRVSISDIVLYTGIRNVGYDKTILFRQHACLKPTVIISCLLCVKTIPRYAQ